MLSIRFDHPWLLSLLLLALPLVWLGRRRLVAIEPERRNAAMALRVLLLTVVTLLLAGLQVTRTIEDLAVVALVDQSESARKLAAPPGGAEYEPWIRQWLEQAGRGRRADDRFGWIAFDGRPRVRAMPDRAMHLDAGVVDDPVEGTDVASAIRLGMATFGADTSRRLLLVWDGHDTTGNDSESAAAVLTAAREAAAAGVPIDVLPLDYSRRREVVVEALHAPLEARRGQTIPLRIVLQATEPTYGTLSVLYNGEPVDLTPGIAGHGIAVTPEQWSTATAAQLAESSSSGQFISVRVVELPIEGNGAARFEAIFEPAAGSDQLSTNNRAQAFTLVHGKGVLLLVDNVEGGAGKILARSLQDKGMDLKVISPAEFPVEAAELGAYDAVLLQNVPADAMTTSQQRMVATYVSEMGGGLVMIGGPESFGAGGWTNSPVDAVLPVNCQIPSQKIVPAGALVIVLDRSGSMAASVAGSSQSQQDLANEAAVLAISALYPQDLVGVVAFDQSASWVVSLQPMGDPRPLASKIRSIQPGGGTNIASGLELAMEQLALITPEQASVRHVILLTDGQSEGAPLPPMATKLAKAGISLSTVGVGNGVNASLLQDLARIGGGRYYPVTDPRKLPQIFIKEARTVRKNLLKEVKFAPVVRNSGSPVTAGLGQPPTLKGLVLTGSKRDPRVYQAMSGPEGEPLFAHWQVGLGRSAAFTSDATSRWAEQWLSWEGYSDFWGRVARMVARPSQGRGYDLQTRLDGQMLRLKVDASGAGQVGGFLDLHGTVLSPDGKSSTPVRLQQTGPGIYEAAVPARQTGTYLVHLLASDPQQGGEATLVLGGAVRSSGAELRRFTSDRALIEAVARETGGRVMDALSPEAATLYSRDAVKPIRWVRPVWQPLMIAMLLLLLLDVACRRIAWDAASIRQWTRARLQAALGTQQARDAEASAQTLGRLKARAAEVDQQLAEGNPGSPAAAPAANSAATPAANSGRREARGSSTAAARSRAPEPAREPVPVNPVPAQPLPSEAQPTPSEMGEAQQAKQRARDRLLRKNDSAPNPPTE